MPRVACLLFTLVRGIRIAYGPMFIVTQNSTVFLVHKGREIVYHHRMLPI